MNISFVIKDIQFKEWSNHTVTLLIIKYTNKFTYDLWWWKHHSKGIVIFRNHCSMNAYEINVSMKLTTIIIKRDIVSSKCL